jgi:protein-S-isoprenylcysteine O-methyltransferase Ste14
MASFRRSMIVSILFVVFGGPGFGVVYLPLWITRFHIPAAEPWWQRSLAFVIIAAGLLPALESVWRFIAVGRGTLVPVVPTEQLVVSGLYRHVRNPMYVGVLTAVAGEALLFESRSMVAYFFALCLLFYSFVRLYEERMLARRYGQHYAVYKQNVRRWLPRLRPWEGKGL